MSVDGKAVRDISGGVSFDGKHIRCSIRERMYISIDWMSIQSQQRNTIINNSAIVLIAGRSVDSGLVSRVGHQCGSVPMRELRVIRVVSNIVIDVAAASTIEMRQRIDANRCEQSNIQLGVFVRLGFGQGGCDW